ncbi:hypothetical protein GKZ89_05970 [Bacillus mangrovi]|uniref:Uroporphyrinogen-III synthase n=1 Tax=Metabacillus mangrovi TaxID=1491830 RepID=A0A7X2V4C0_9BACI|nr:uroporphyrinogen-III synthase [Metabacillus mangrovi]MTH52951.1 hypothetical protein [Metabacillus mangrovi]
MNDKKPLEGKRILVTRERSQAASFVRLLEQNGAVPVICPMIEFRPAGNEQTILNVLGRLDAYDWLIFTSANGVRYFEAFMKQGRFSVPEKIRTAAVGVKTAECLEAIAIKPDIIPDKFSGEQLAEKLAGAVKKGERVLIIRGNLSRQAVYKKLNDIQIAAEELVLYENKPVRGNEQERTKLLLDADYITFTSPSIAEACLKLLEEAEAPFPVFACIGDVTAETVRKYGYDGLIARPFTGEGLVQAMIAHANKEE